MFTGDIEDSLRDGSGVGGFSCVSLSVISRRAATELQGKLIAMDTESIPAEKRRNLFSCQHLQRQRKSKG